MSTLISRLIVAGLLGSLPITLAHAKPPDYRRGEILLSGPPDAHPNAQVVRYYPRSNISVAKVETGTEGTQVSRHSSQGRKAGLNLKVKKFYTSDDPLSAYQWHFDNIELEDAQTLSEGAGVVVAVLDTGFKPGGEDSVACTVPGWDIINDDADPMDDDGHGTHVTGTVAQTTDNGLGVAGVAPSSCIMPIKVLDASGSGTFAELAEGIYLAVDEGANVINMSLGIAAYYRVTNDPFVDDALDYAYDHDVTVVAAAGNESFPLNVGYPAIYPSVIAVGATNILNTRAYYSNYGTGLDIMAPGGETLFDRNGDGFADGVLQETFDGSGSFGYWFFQGTSMASPHVAGVAALLIAHGVASTPDDVLSVIQSTALDLGPSGPDSQYSYGLIQPFAALNSGVPPEEPPPEEPPPEEPPPEEPPPEEPPPEEPPPEEPPPGRPPVDPPEEPPEEEPPEEPPEECTDADNDGVCVEDGDCDDSDPFIHPGFPDSGRYANDNKDNDCNGVVDG
ncbi:S8 family serine peptidase [Litoribrevibacter euphylliae]|uniref:S8 family serine peptidase n=1 Tax=Litoribrevibacter euphylliae TaxID=1834034 RepID=A0ABV7HHD4_9GAMM